MKWNNPKNELPKDGVKVLVLTQSMGFGETRRFINESEFCSNIGWSCIYDGKSMTVMGWREHPGYDVEEELNGIHSS